MTGLNDFHYAQFLLEELYGIKLPDEKFEEIDLLPISVQAIKE